MLTTWFEIDKAETTTSQEILDAGGRSNPSETDREKRPKTQVCVPIKVYVHSRFELVHLTEIEGYSYPTT